MCCMSQASLYKKDMPIGVPYKPTPAIRKLVGKLAGYGLTWPQIGATLGISGEVAQRHHQADYTKGISDINGKVIASLAQLAVGWCEKDKKGNITKRLPPNVVACIYWTKTRCRWHESVEADPDNVPTRPLLIIPGLKVPGTNHTGEPSP
jgi:hypothetical protein